MQHSTRRETICSCIVDRIYIIICANIGVCVDRDEFIKRVEVIFKVKAAIAARNTCIIRLWGVKIACFIIAHYSIIVRVVSGVVEEA